MFRDFDHVGFFVSDFVDKVFFEESHHVYYARTCIFARSGRRHVYLLGRWVRAHRRHRGGCAFASPVSVHGTGIGFRRANVVQRDVGESSLGEGFPPLRRGGSALQAPKQVFANPFGLHSAHSDRRLRGVVLPPGPKAPSLTI